MLSSQLARFRGFFDRKKRIRKQMQVIEIEGDPEWETKRERGKKRVFRGERVKQKSGEYVREWKKLGSVRQLTRTRSSRIAVVRQPPFDFSCCLSLPSLLSLSPFVSSLTSRSGRCRLEAAKKKSRCRIRLGRNTSDGWEEKRRKRRDAIDSSSCSSLTYSLARCISQQRCCTFDALRIQPILELTCTSTIVHLTGFPASSFPC